MGGRDPGGGAEQAQHGAVPRYNTADGHQVIGPPGHFKDPPQPHLLQRPQPHGPVPCCTSLCFTVVLQCILLLAVLLLSFASALEVIGQQTCTVLIPPPPELDTN